MIRYPFAITIKALQNHNLFSFHYKNELQVHVKLIKPIYLAPYYGVQYYRQYLLF